VKVRLIWAIAAVATAAVILFGIPLAIVLQRTYRDEEVLRLQRDTIAATRSIDTGAASGDRPELPHFAGQVALYGEALGRIAGSGPTRADATVRRAIASRAPQRSEPSGPLVVAIPIFHNERIVGAVRGERTQTAVTARTHRAWLWLAAGAAAVIALAILAAFGLGRWLARPLESLAAVARRVGAGDFAARAPREGIAEVDALAAALDASSQRIAQLVAREREFTANASHQLRTPLAALRLELESGLLERDDDPVLRAALRQAERLEATIATLLAHARNRPSDQAAYVELDDALARVRERWHWRIAAAGRPLRISAPHPTAPALISPAVLDEVLDVLIDNALRHGAGTVTVSVRPTSDALALEVTDQGAGLGEDPERAFARGVGNGSGIGLALARSLAHAQGAMLTVTRSGPHPTFTLLIQPVPGAVSERPAGALGASAGAPNR
jgi:signal transduction histidine kinase